MSSKRRESFVAEMRGAALWIAALYVLVGALWILLSDQVVGMLARDSETLSRLQTAKGWFYVSVTGVLLYLLVLGHLMRRAGVEQDLRGLNQTLETVIQASPVAIIVLGADGRVQRWHPVAEHVLGWTKAETVGRSLPEVMGEMGTELSSAYTRALRGECFTSLEMPGHRKDGSHVHLSVSMAPLRDAQGAVVGVVCVGADITQRKAAEEELRAAQDRVLIVEAEKKRFYREVIRATTHGKLHLVDVGEIPTEGNLVLDEPLHGADRYRAVRRRIRDAALELGMSAEAASDIEMAAGEAMLNASKHGVDGRCAVYIAPGRVIVRISDRGRGIRAEDLPATVLLPGFSTKLSLGMGYTLMLELADQVWLATGPEGTVVQVEKRVCHEELSPLASPGSRERL